jgi:hypothetical protein
MTLKQFTHAIDVVKDYRKIEKELEKAFGGLNENHNYGMLSTVETQYLTLLKIAMNDEHDWVSYFIYDCEMGTKPKEITFKDGTKLKLKTVAQLYKLIHTEI